MFTICWMSEGIRKSLLGSEGREHILICVFMSSPYHVWNNSSRLFPFWYQQPKPTVGDSKASMCLWDTLQEISMEHYPQSLWAASEEAARVKLRLLLVVHGGAFSAAFWPECLPSSTPPGPGAALVRVSSPSRSDGTKAWSYLSARCGFQKASDLRVRNLVTGVKCRSMTWAESAQGFVWFSPLFSAGNMFKSSVVF